MTTDPNQPYQPQPWEKGPGIPEQPQQFTAPSAPAPYGQAPQASYGKAPQADPYAQQAPYGQSPQANPYQQQAPYGQAQQVPYGQAPQANPYAPQQAPYGQPAGYGNVIPNTATAGQRIVANLIDSAVLTVVFGLIFALVFNSDNLGSLSILNLVLFAIPLAYYGILNGQGQTVGKMAMKIKVVDEATGAPIGFGRGVVRYLMYVLMNAAIYIGDIMWLAHPEHRGWHDKVAKTSVIRVG